MVYDLTASTPPRCVPHPNRVAYRIQSPFQQHGVDNGDRHQHARYERRSATTITPLAEVLRQNGYNTAFFGKSHEVPPWEISQVGPQDRWPTRSGFEKFYGFIGGETNQYAPTLYDGVTLVEAPTDPNYHFTVDMTNQAIQWTQFQKSLAPDKPFFVYYAPGATHAPHHVPREWSDRFKGKFDAGWDKLRESTLAKQIELGIVPSGTKLAPKPEDIKDWDDLTPEQKKLFTRQVEVYAVSRRTQITRSVGSSMPFAS